MTMRTGVLCAFAFCAVASLNADPNHIVLINQGWFDGKDFLDAGNSGRIALAAGVVSGLFMSPLMGGPERGREIVALSKCTTGMSTGQIGAIVEKYIRDRPETWHHALSILTVQAMAKACPEFDAALSAVVPPAAPVKP